MKKRIVSWVLVFAVVFSLQTVAFATPTSEQVYKSMIELKSDYPEGMPWTNDNYYPWNGGVYSGGYGCAGFAFLLSDAAFGNLPARVGEVNSISDLRVGDILRINNDTHSVIVLEVLNNAVVVAEGNYNSSIHWGRVLSEQKVLASDYMMTRYPVEASIGVFKDVGLDSYCAKPVMWAVENNITNGTSATTFSPQQTCTTAQILTFLYRAQGEPMLKIENPFTNVSDDDYYSRSAVWAYENGLLPEDEPMFSEAVPCTRSMVVTYLWTLAGKPEGEVSGFTDVPVDAPYSAAVAWALAEGITKGTSATAFSPEKICTRGEIVTFLWRAIS